MIAPPVYPFDILVICLLRSCLSCLYPFDYFVLYLCFAPFDYPFIIPLIVCYILLTISLSVCYLFFKFGPICTLHLHYSGKQYLV